MPTRLEIAWPDIVRTFEEHRSRPMTCSDVAKVLGENRTSWRLAQNTTVGVFIEFLKSRNQLQEHRLEFPYRPTTRYVWGKASIFEIVQSLNRDGFFSHYTAVYLHQLTEQHPKTIYFNVEQPAKGTGSGLTQESINRAFRGACRKSSNLATLDDRVICTISGKNTDNLGVIDFESEAGRGLRVTNVERTLIDAAVRPVYAGGPHEVAKAYKNAHGRISLARIIAYVRQLEYTYPIHQSIGYYLQRSGAYTQSQLQPLRDLGLAFDFFLDYGMKEPEFVPSWRLFVPKGFQAFA